MRNTECGMLNDRLRRLFNDELRILYSVIERSEIIPHSTFLIPHSSFHILKCTPNSKGQLGVVVA